MPCREAQGYPNDAQREIAALTDRHGRRLVRNVRPRPLLLLVDGEASRLEVI